MDPADRGQIEEVYRRDLARLRNDLERKIGKIRAARD
jgi:hypothetical protein